MLQSKRLIIAKIIDRAVPISRPVASTLLLVVLTTRMSKPPPTPELPAGVLEISKMADSYTSCSGLYDAISWLNQRFDDMNTAQLYQEQGNSAEITAWIILMVAGSPKDRAIAIAKDHRLSNGANFRSMISNSPLPENLAAELMKCIEIYGPLQREMTDAMHAYEASGSNDPKLFWQLVYQAFARSQKQN